VAAPILEVVARSGHQVANGARDEDLAGARFRRHAGGQMDGNPGDLAVQPLPSPVWIPARISRPIARTPSRIAQAAAIARPGPSKEATKPSPVVLISSPQCSARRLLVSPLRA
jgi:hypothetical protein